jgi:hypothetical protein
MQLFTNCYAIGKQKLLQNSEVFINLLSKYENIQQESFYHVYPKIEYLDMQIHSQKLVKQSTTNSSAIRYLNNQ